MRRSILFFAVIIFQFLTSLVFAQVSQQWVERFTSDSTLDESVNDMFVDEQGNFYVTGSQKGPSQSQLEAVTVKYNSNGVQQWIQNYHAPLNNGAFGRAIHVDDVGNVYVTGENAIVSGGANEALIIKYNSVGTQLWSYRFQYIQGLYCGGYDIVTDADGNIYVTGEYYTGVNFLNNIFLAKFDLNGNIVNQIFYNSGSEGGRKIALDGTGKIIVGGYVNDNDSLSFIALKYEQNLDFVWASRWGLNVGNQNVIDMTIDNNNNIILAGTSNLDYEIVKIDPSGIVQWSKLYNSPAGWDYCKGVVNDDIGNIYVTGETGTLGFPLSYKITTIKYSPDGNEIWVNKFDSDTTYTDGYAGYNIAIDNFANVYVIGQKYSSSDITTIKYNSEGSFQWAINYNGPSNSLDIPVAIGVDLNGNVYSTGKSLDFTTGYDIVIIKYVQSPTSVDRESNIPNSFSLEQNYPNPFNPSTSIQYAISSKQFVTLKVFDVLGKEIATLVNEEKSAGSYEVNFNASQFSSGVYFYELQTGSFVETRKMILLK
ncbi:MAG: T9SS type A sorting domain-containing protein [Ignavibacteriales bacterium]|nr:T9SS type A sorting domain-containing protein [Ignavibacteriales bacterium]